MIDPTRDPGTESSRVRGRETPTPGLALVFSDGQPCLAVAQVGEPHLDIGREEGLPISLKDSAVSRVHTRVAYRAGVWSISDLGSKNGTFVDGERLEAPAVGSHLRVLRVGGSIFLLLHDIRAYAGASIDRTDGKIIGPSLRDAVERTRRIGKAGQDLHLTGETGVGKEVFAREYHAASAEVPGPFVAVNCATIPKELAESTLFGAKRGAYTGAHADQVGLFRAADGGTLFLDELGELDIALQSKLLRVLELREVIPVGSTKPQPVTVRVCSATLGDLRELVRLGRFRDDLYFRIARPVVAIPPLRERPEEVPWLMQQAMASVSESLQLTAAVVETCLSRTWPGNVRELMASVRDAAHEAADAGSRALKVSHLDPGAGLAFGPSFEPGRAAPEPLAASLAPGAGPGGTDELRLRVEQVLRKTAGNVSRSARVLGWHRTQLRRYLDREGIDAQAFAAVEGES